MAIGMVRLGISVARGLRRKAKITPTTSSTASTSVNFTSDTEARISWVRSTTVRTLMEGGMLASRRGSSRWIASTALMTLVPGCLNTIRATPGFTWPPVACQAASSRF